MVIQHFLADTVSAYDLISSGARIPRGSIVRWQNAEYRVDRANGYCLTLVALNMTSALAWASVDTRNDKTVMVISTAEWRE